MSITEEAVLTIAEVEVNDGYRVELWQCRKRTDYSPEQAERLAADLLRAAASARAAFTEFELNEALRLAEQAPLGTDRDTITVAAEALRAIAKSGPKVADFDQQMRARGLRVVETHRGSAVPDHNGEPSCSECGWAPAPDPEDAHPIGSRADAVAAILRPHPTPTPNIRKDCQ